MACIHLPQYTFSHSLGLVFIMFGNAGGGGSADLCLCTDGSPAQAGPAEWAREGPGSILVVGDTGEDAAW